MPKTDKTSPAPRTRSQWRAWMQRHFDHQRVLADIQRFFDSARYCSTARLRELAHDQVRRMRRDGFSDAEVLEVPADGRTRFGGWVMPLAWTPLAARLELLPGRKDQAPELLADYADNPHQLMMFSRPTPRRGVKAEVVAVDLPAGPAQLRRLRGKIALLAKYATVSEILPLLRAGALGVIDDNAVTIPGVKEGTRLDRAVQYHNYTLPPWEEKAAGRAFGFALSPERGRRLRERLAAGERVTVRAVVEVEIGKGTWPIITGAVPGAGNREILLTGHIDEPGANDNASGPAMALEIGRQLLAAGKRGAVLRRGLRFFFSTELRALQALMNLEPQRFRPGLVGLDLDMVGCDPAKVKSALKIVPNQPALPDWGLPLLLDCLEPLARKHGDRYRARLQRLDTNDNGMGEPALGVPTSVVMFAPDANYHTDLDVPAACSGRAIRRMGVALGTWTGTLATAGPREVRKLLDIAHGFARDELQRTLAAARERKWSARETAARLQHVLRRENTRLRGPLQLLDNEHVVLVDAPESHPRIFASAGLTPTAHAREHAQALAADLAAEARAGAGSGKNASPAPGCLLPRGTAPRLVQRCRDCVPLKLFHGHFTYDGLPGNASQRLARATGSAPGWCAPAWLQVALNLSTGKRNLLEIHHLLACEGYAPPLERLYKTCGELLKQGYVRLRPVVKEAQLVRVLKKLGVRRGQVLMAHSALSRFGYVEGGPRALIGILEKMLGPTGTLCMPTHSLNWMGQPAYDPQRSPSQVGAVTEVFRKLPGVLRSQHPTHSVAAKGPLAAELLAGHDEQCAPQGKEGFWGKFVDAGGKVLMLCPLSSNTLLHAAELWGGVPFPDGLVRVQVFRSSRVKVCPQVPMHVKWFERVYQRLRRKGRLASERLGEGEAYFMDAQEAIAEGLAVVRRNRGLSARCNCAWCRCVRAKL